MSKDEKETKKRARKGRGVLVLVWGVVRVGWQRRGVDVWSCGRGTLKGALSGAVWGLELGVRGRRVGIRGFLVFGRSCSGRDVERKTQLFAGGHHLLLAVASTVEGSDCDGLFC